MMTLGAMMAGGNPDPERGRAEDDWYPTPRDVTQALKQTLHPVLWGNVWEPCAGDGVMLDELERNSIRNVYGSDINPRRDDIDQLDFFNCASMLRGANAIITNPPFDCAERFIRHAFKIGVQRMALVLKSTYWHSKNRNKGLWNDHRPSMIMPLTWRPDFKGLGRPTMEVMWCVWERDFTGYPPYVPLNRPA